MYQKILELNTSIQNKQVIYKHFKNFLLMNKNDDEYLKLKKWIRWSLDLPYDNIIQFKYKSTEISRLLKKTKISLDKHLYGMENVKKQILMFLHLKFTNSNYKHYSLGLIGPPGVGKTKISLLLSELLDIPFYQISFGGITTPEFLKGHDYTYIGSHPGEIIKSLKYMQCKNGILFFDEFEKISENKSHYYILQILQNKEFRDNFLSDLTFDLSHLWFIYSMNSKPNDNALTDRIQFIHVDGYTLQDKIKMVQDFFIPQICSLLKLNIKNYHFNHKNIQFFLLNI